MLRATPRVLPEWIFYFVRREPFRAEAKRNFTGTAGQQRVPSSFLQSVKIPLPSLYEQRRIVDILSRAESIVRLRREAQKKAAELIPALFLDTFGDPATNPKGWPMVALGDVLAEPPTLGTMAKPSRERGTWLDLRVANIQGGLLTIDDKRWLELPDDHVRRFALRDGDLILARAIGSLDHLGKAVVVNTHGESWTFDSHLMRVRLDQTTLLPEFLKYFLESPGGREEFLKHTRRSAVQFNINGKELRQIRCIIPPIERQRSFQKILADVNAIASQQSTATTQAEATFNALLAQVFAAA